MTSLRTHVRTCLGFFLIFGVTTALLCGARPVVADSHAGGETASEAAALVETLGTDAPTFDKAKACYRLAAIGDASAVPALAKLLDDAELSNYGRHALERIGGDEAKAALRDALARVEGDLLVGVIGSLGRMADEDAVIPLALELKQGDATVAVAAARALGRIGSEEGVKVLQDALEKDANTPAAAHQRNAAALGLIVAAQQVARAADDAGRARAFALCDQVQQAKVAEPHRLSALHTSLVAGGAPGRARLSELLRGPDWPRFQVAIRAAREMQLDISAELAAQFDRRDADQQVVILSALADYGDAASLPTVLKAATSGPPIVRTKAFDALVRLGAAESVPTLVAAARDADSTIAKAAQAALVALDADEVDVAVLAMFDEADKDALLLAIDLAARRLMSSATGKIWKLTKHEDEQLRLAALRALGTTASADDWPMLITAVSLDDDTPERQAAREAAEMACTRIPQSQSAQILSTAFDAAKADDQPYLLELLGQVGGPLALKKVAAVAGSESDAHRDAGTRVLGNWKTPDVAPVLYELATTFDERKYKIRTLRGYIRVARYLSVPIGERLDMCEAALRLADRSEERLLVLDVLRVHGVPRGLRIATTLLGDEDNEVVEMAARVIVILARGYVRGFPNHAENALVPALELAKDERVQEVGQQVLAEAREILAKRAEAEQE